MKILQADDHPLFREGIRHILQRLNTEVEVELLEADSVAAALRLANAHDDIDLILLDLHMPGESGCAGLLALWQACPSVPIVVLSAS